MHSAVRGHGEIEPSLSKDRGRRDAQLVTTPPCTPSSRVAVGYTAFEALIPGVPRRITEVPEQSKNSKRNPSVLKRDAVHT